MIDRLLNDVLRLSPQLTKWLGPIIRYYIYNPRALEQLLQGTVSASTQVYKYIQKKANEYIKSLKLKVVILGQPGTGKTTMMQYIGENNDIYTEPSVLVPSKGKGVIATEIDNIVDDKDYEDLIAKQLTVSGADAVIYLVNYLTLSNAMHNKEIDIKVQDDLEHLAHWLKKDGCENYRVIIVITFCDYLNDFSLTDFRKNIELTQNLISSNKVQMMLDIIGRRRTLVFCGSLKTPKTSYYLTANIAKSLEKLHR